MGRINSSAVTATNMSRMARSALCRSRALSSLRTTRLRSLHRLPRWCLTRADAIKRTLVLLSYLIPDVNDPANKQLSITEHVTIETLLSKKIIPAAGRFTLTVKSSKKEERVEVSVKKSGFDFSFGAQKTTQTLPTLTGILNEVFPRLGVFYPESYNHIYLGEKALADFLEQPKAPPPPTAHELMQSLYDDEDDDDEKSPDKMDIDIVEDAAPEKVAGAVADNDVDAMDIDAPPLQTTNSSPPIPPPAPAPAPVPDLNPGLSQFTTDMAPFEERALNLIAAVRRYPFNRVVVTVEGGNNYFGIWADYSQARKMFCSLGDDFLFDKLWGRPDLKEMAELHPATGHLFAAANLDPTKNLVVHHVVGARPPLRADKNTEASGILFKLSTGTTLLLHVSGRVLVDPSSGHGSLTVWTKHPKAVVRDENALVLENALYLFFVPFGDKESYVTLSFYSSQQDDFFHAVAIEENVVDAVAIVPAKRAFEFRDSAHAVHCAEYFFGKLSEKYDAWNAQLSIGAPAYSSTLFESPKMGAVNNDLQVLEMKRSQIDVTASMLDDPHDLIDSLTFVPDPMDSSGFLVKSDFNDLILFERGLIFVDGKLLTVNRTFKRLAICDPGKKRLVCTPLPDRVIPAELSSLLLAYQQTSLQDLKGGEDNAENIVKCCELLYGKVCKSLRVSNPGFTLKLSSDGAKLSSSSSS
jgi:hypothetical protein